jgi:NAD(P)H dehydrogenase (quinone)
MKHAVILAHPNSRSFCASIARTCMEELGALGHRAELRDLYAIGFDPCLKAREVPTDAGFSAASDVEAERRLLQDIDSFIFVYPFWFNAPPAMLKGYVDRVFGLNFGYAPGFGCVEPLLTGRTLMSVSTSGAPDHWVNSTGAVQTLMDAVDHHVAAVCGLRVVDHMHFGGIVSNMDVDPAEDMLQKVRSRLVELFPTERSIPRPQGPAAG